MRVRLSHTEFASLCIKLTPDKERLQTQLENGITIASLALKHKVSPRTMRQVLTFIGVKPVHGGARDVIKGLHTNICTVLARVCEQLDVNYDEIKPYLAQ